MNYKRKRNQCVNLLRKEKRKYYNELDLRILSDNKRFWTNAKPLMSDKHKTLDKSIVLIENDCIIAEDDKVADTLNDFFINSVENLDIKKCTG